MAKVMLEKFLSYIQTNNLLNSDDKILLAVSGGIDSMAMLYLFHKSDWNFGVAHVNYMLREDESIEEESIVTNYCNKNNIPLHIYRSKKGDFKDSNVQLRAREVRYSFFSEVSYQCGYTKIATAHHRQDNVETLFINLMRGSGLSGLQGIPLNANNFIRPLLNVNREEIVEFQKVHNFPFHHDSSNFKLDYTRNKIRSQLIPLIYKIDPRSVHGIMTTMSNVKKSKLLLDQLIAHISANTVTVDNQTMSIDLNKIQNIDTSSQLLYEILKSKHFNETTCALIMSKINQNGAIFLSESHQALIHNQTLKVRVKQGNLEPFLACLPSIPPTLSTGYDTFSFQQIPYNQVHCFIGAKDTLVVDFHKIALPLIVRKKMSGDKLKPLGMNGRHQKVKDLLINKKVSKFDKENVIILEDQNGIVGVFPFAIDELYKVTEHTLVALIISKV